MFLSTLRICHRRFFFAHFVLLGPVPAFAQEPLGLERYLQIVLRAHPSARQAEAQQRVAEAERRGAGLFADPVVEYSQSRASVEGLRATERNFAVSQVLPWPGWRSAEILASEKSGDARRAAGQALLWDLEAEARETFTRLVEARAATALEKAAEGDARSLRDLVARRVELGEARESDRVKANIEWRLQETAVVVAEREEAQAEKALRTLAVGPLPVPLVVEGATWASPAPTDPAGISDRLSATPGLRVAIAAEQREAALLRLARTRQKPDLEVRVFHGTEFDKTFRGLSFGARVPLWNANRGEVARAEAAVSLAAAEVSRTRLDLERRLDLLLKDFEVAARQAQTLNLDVLPAANESVRLVRFSYEEGEASLIDVLDAQRTLRGTQREAIQARLELTRAVGQLQRLIGPDFNPWSVTR